MVCSFSFMDKNNLRIFNFVGAALAAMIAANAASTIKPYIASLFDAGRVLQTRPKRLKESSPDLTAVILC
jgi:hypothetical protein